MPRPWRGFSFWKEENSFMKYAPTMPQSGMVPGAGLVVGLLGGKGGRKKAESCGKKWLIFRF